MVCVDINEVGTLVVWLVTVVCVVVSYSELVVGLVEWAVLVLRDDSLDSVLLVVWIELELCVETDDAGLVVTVLVT